MQHLPDNLYSVDSVVRLEQLVINQCHIPAYQLMSRAGEVVFNTLVMRYPKVKKLLVLCGAGNNAGDGYVVARLAKQAGLEVNVISLTEPERLKNEARLAYQDWLSVGVNAAAELSLVDESEIIIDALLGTGLTREVSSDWINWFDAVNSSIVPVIAVDIPSGLIADTGAIAGTAIKADITVSFIGLKQGLFTAQAKDVCGEIIFDDLAVPPEAYAQIGPDAVLIQTPDYSLLPKRKASSHKGKFGHVLIVGGNTGMPGAVILAARAALRTGAGLVTVVTREENMQAISSAVPEAMIKSCETQTLAEVFTESFVNSITHIAIGMGLGQDEWAIELLRYCTRLAKPMLIDADALNIMAAHNIAITEPVMITPHPGEAARLLSEQTELNSADIQQDRFGAVRKLINQLNNDECTVILKGSGTLIYDGKIIKVCSAGNAAMAAPGMGDVLSGIVISLMAQGLTMGDAAELGVCLHAASAEMMTEGKTRGLLASDIVDAIRQVVQ